MSDPITEPTPTPAPAVKPGWKTTEFWLSAIVALGGLAMASGLIAPGTVADKIVGMVLATLAGLGYTGSRTAVKNS